MMDCRFQVVDTKKVALQNFLAPTNKKVTMTDDDDDYDDDDYGIKYLTIFVCLQIFEEQFVLLHYQELSY